MTPEEKTLRSRLAAHARWSQEDPKPQMERARQKFRESFEQKVDPEGVLPPEERARRAEQARRAHYARMALRSVQSRRERAASR